MLGTRKNNNLQLKEHLGDKRKRLETAGELFPLKERELRRKINRLHCRTCIACIVPIMEHVIVTLSVICLDNVSVINTHLLTVLKRVWVK